MLLLSEIVSGVSVLLLRCDDLRPLRAVPVAACTNLDTKREPSRWSRSTEQLIGIELETLLERYYF